MALSDPYLALQAYAGAAISDNIETPVQSKCGDNE